MLPRPASPRNAFRTPSAPDHRRAGHGHASPRSGPLPSHRLVGGTRLNRPALDGYIGVDGGGSRCRVRICDPEGRVRGEAEGGAANVYLDFDGALATIQETVAKAIRTADLVAATRIAAGLGLAGASSPAVASHVRAALSGFESAVVAADGTAACLGAHGGRDGGLVIAGTGSSALLMSGRQATSIGGRGFLLGDDGSGAWIGRALWRRALRAHDGLEPRSPLLASLMAAFHDDPAKVIAWGRTAPSHEFAGYAPRAFAAANRGDAAALAVIHAAAEAIAELIAALQQRAAPRISLVGGMAEAIAPWLPERVRAALAPPRADALDGALFLAGLAPEKRLGAAV